MQFLINYVFLKLKRLHKISLISLIAMCFLWSNISSADDFLVEIILFRNLGQINDNSHIAPEDWAAGADEAVAEPTSASMRNMASKLASSSNYEVLTHQAFKYSFNNLPKSVVFVDGEPNYGRYPIEGKITFSWGAVVQAKFNLWVNEFDSYNLIFKSELIKQTKKMRLDKVYYVDQSNLGALIKVKRYIHN